MAFVSSKKQKKKPRKADERESFFVFIISQRWKQIVTVLQEESILTRQSCIFQLLSSL